MEELPEGFRKLLHTKLNWSRLEAGGGDSGVTGWVFWNREDDRPNTLPVSDFDNTKVKDKIRLALGRILLHKRCGPTLGQFWAPTQIEGRTLLTTQNQPFALSEMGRSTWGLADYRMKCMDHTFYGDIGDSGEEEHMGLPGRVFLHELPESTPDVQYYTVKEYPRRDDASRCQVRASWGLPVFQFNLSSQVYDIVGVLELISAVNAITDWHDKSFLDNLYGVLQGLDLPAFNVYNHCEMKYKDEDNALTTAFPELLSVLESVYNTHNLPLALTWVHCNYCNGLWVGRRLSEDGEYLGAFKPKDDHLVNFLTTSTGYHLWKGHVAERALGSTSMVYCSDVKQFSVAEYPLVPFARQCKLRGWFTIRLRSSCTGDVYILEFFLPTSSKDNGDTLTTISKILGTVKANSKTFKLASGEELGEELSVLVLDFQNGQRRECKKTIGASLEFLKNGGLTLPVIEVDDGMDVLSAEQNDTTKTQETKRKRTGVKFDISLDEILQFSALSRKEAAAVLGVSESTLKRVCREHGINRWPPRDINKLVGAAQPSSDVLPCDIYKVGAQQPSHVEHEEGGSELTVAKVGAPQSSSRDVPLHNVNKVGSSWPSSVEQQQGTSQLSKLTWDMPWENVAIKAKYDKCFMRFNLSTSGIQELKQQVAKRLSAEGGNYCFNYEDEAGDLVVIECDEDLHTCISLYKDRGQTVVPIVILPRSL